MKFYDKNNTEILDCLVSDDSYCYRKIMDDDTLTLYLDLPNNFSPQIDMYCIFQGRTYYFIDNKSITQNGSRNFSYTLELKSAKFLASKFILKASDGRVKFPMTAKAVDFVTLFVSNLNARSSGWSVGEVAETTEKTIVFNHVTIFDAFALLAETFKTEYDFDDKTFNFGRVEYNKDNPLSMSIRDGFKVGTKITSDSRPIEVLYVQGTDRNIDFSTYGSKELLLPISQVLNYQGRDYISSSDGRSIRRYNKTLISGQEDSLDLTEIYPSREGVVSSVVAVDAENNLYDFIDTSIPEGLDYNDCMIAGEKMTVIFQTGMLAGREFEISKYTHSTRRFEIVPSEQDGIAMPGGVYIPATGAKYKIFGIQLPTAYICDNVSKTGASWDMFREAAKYLYEHEDDVYTLDSPVDSIWTREKWLEVGGMIRLGGYIHYDNVSLFGLSGVDIRIIGIKSGINNPYKINLDLSNALVGVTTGEKMKQPDPNPIIIDQKYKDSVRFTKRRYRDALETMSMLEKAIDGFSGSINPIYIQTMAILVGSASLQFRFVNNKTTPSVVSPSFTYSDSTKVFSAPTTILQHLTLGINTVSPTHAVSEYRFWDITSYTSPALTDASKAYYFYAKCSKTGNTGTFILSETVYKFDTDADYYYMLVGTLGAESGGVRSFITVYGFTEILPGRITADKFVSPTGETYIDFSAGNGKGKIGGVFEFLAGSTGLENIEGWSGIQYIADAIMSGNTTIAGGLLLTNLLFMKSLGGDVISGLSGLNDGIFFFADPSNAYQKALNGTAMFVIKKNGTAKFGIMKIENDSVSIMFDGSEILRFQTDNLPDLSELVTNLDEDIAVTNFSFASDDTGTGESAYSSPLTVSSLSQFTFSCTGTISATGYYDEDHGDLASAIMRMVLYRVNGSEYEYVREIATVSGFDAAGITVNVDSNFSLSAGSYVVRFEYAITAGLGHEASVSSSSIVLNAKGSAAQQKMIFAKNGFARIKDGFNYDYFSDTVGKISRGENRYAKFSPTDNFLEVKGAVFMSGLWGSGSVSSGGTLSNATGKAADSAKTSTGLYTVTHNIGHTDYSVALTVINSDARINAVITSKGTTSFSVRIVNASSNTLTNSAFEFAIYGKNE